MTAQALQNVRVCSSRQPVLSSLTLYVQGLNATAPVGISSWPSHMSRATSHGGRLNPPTGPTQSRFYDGGLRQICPAHPSHSSSKELLLQELEAARAKQRPLQGGFGERGRGTRHD